MILIDSSAWIDCLQIGPASAAYPRVRDLLGETPDAATCGPVLQEVLQGIRDARHGEEVRRLLTSLPYLESTREVFLRAAALHRLARSAGRKVSSGDAVIAAVALHHHAALLTGDRDFHVFQQHAGLRLLPT